MRPIVRETAEHTDRRSFLLFWVAPAMLILIAVALPLITGSKTLYTRDVLNTHYQMKWYQGEAIQEGRMPMIDHVRSGGQAFLGNPNTVPLYPTNLLLYVADPLWVLNAHFWIHWLLAPFAAYWLGRRLGLSRPGAWSLGVFYVTSGYFLSTMNLYNIVAVIALAPALAASALEIGTAGMRRRGFICSALLWGLLILGGDPMTAVSSLLVIFALVLIWFPWRSYPWHLGVGAVGIGTLLTAPQWVDFVRVLGFTFRGYWGYQTDLGGAGGWSPLDALDLLIPFAYGRPDFNYWGQPIHGNNIPLFLCFYFGLLALALAFAAPKDERGVFKWGLGLVLVGLFLSLGEFNPVVVAMTRLPGASLLRTPSKLWNVVALGFAVLGALAFDRMFVEAGRKALRKALLGVGAALALFGLAVFIFPELVAEWFGFYFPADTSGKLAGLARSYWMGSSLISLGLVGFYLLCNKAAEARPRFAAGALLIVHTATQFIALQPLIALDDAEAYNVPSPYVEYLPPGARLAHGGKLELFGPVTIPPLAIPTPDVKWRERQMQRDLYPWAGVRDGFSYELNLSPEGLDSFLTRTLFERTRTAEDHQRIRLLRMSGVQYLLLERDLEDVPEGEVELVVEKLVPISELRIYKILNSVETYEAAGWIRGSAHVSDGLRKISAPDFDPSRIAVLAGEHEPRNGDNGTVEVVAEGPESFEIKVTANNDVALVAQRAFQPMYKGSVNGEPATLFVANLDRLAVKLPAGEHRVKVWIDRRPFHRSFWLALLGVVLLITSAWWLRPKPSEA